MRLSGPIKVSSLQAAGSQSAGARIVGRGEMANLIRAYDWSATPLGPIGSWSKELVAVVNLTISSPTPARTLWGPEFILIYNDSYRFVPGKRHPDALGQPAREGYREAWNVVGPLLEAAYESGETFYVDKLRGPIDMGNGVQENYLDYTYSPVYENGKISGLFGFLRDVTGEVNAARNLRETEARASRVLESIGDAVIVTDVEARVIQMNPVAEALTGWSLDEAAGRGLQDVFRIVDETSRELVESPADKVKRLGTVVGFANHTILIRRDGSETSIDDSGAPIYDDHGQLNGIVLVFRDINERRAAERERSAISKQLFLVLEATTDGVLSLDREWKMIYRNRRAQEILQASGELTGRSFWDTFPDAAFEGSPYVEHYYRAMDERIPGRFEAFYPAPLNAWFSVTVEPAEYGIILFFRDITQLRNEAAALRDREARLNAIYSTSLQYIGLITPDGIVIDCNRASLEFAGNTRADVVGKHFADTPWFTGTPGAPGLVHRAIADAKSGKTFRSELSLVRPSGETIVFDFSLTPVRGGDGSVMFLVPEAHDITEVKRTESALLKSEKLAAVGRLASSIAHEINNPLESVMNLIYLARHSTPPEAEKYLDVADQEIRRVSIIANQTLRFHKQASKPQAATSADLFSTVMSIYEGRLRNARVRVEMRFRAEKPVVCFQGDVRQVLNNLVANALEAMPFGGRLLIRSREGRDWKTGATGLVLTIADNGAGISPSVMKNIFDAFFTTKGTAGNGLGLWVCQEIVARHHGALRVRSTQRSGRSGTTFSLFLPFDVARDERTTP
jgi:PAS domain S-box-containing protein